MFFLIFLGEGDIFDFMDVYVEKLEDGLFKWKIFCFLVMEVEFKYVWVIINGKCQKIFLLKDSLRLKSLVSVCCILYCIIIIKS